MLAKTVQRMGLAFLLVTLSACGLIGPDTTPDYRYRLTVEIDTLEGVVTG